MCYTTVLALEFAPVLFERLRWRRMWKITHAITLPLVIVGILLSTMHQSSLGSLWLIAPGKLHELWYTPWLPVLFWISAITVGLGMVTVESNLSSRALKRGLEQHLLANLAKANSFLLAFYAIFKIADVVLRGQAALLTEPTVQTALFWVELGLCAILPAILMSQPKIREHGKALFATAGLVVVGGILNRLNVSVFGLLPYTGPIYLPSWMEIVLTAALFTFGAAAFLVAAKLLPVFPKEEPEAVPVIG
jgi:Ni/Fe-hydrogenase subunit HybB-like protein